MIIVDKFVDPFDRVTYCCLILGYVTCLIDLASVRANHLGCTREQAKNVDFALAYGVTLKLANR